MKPPAHIDVAAPDVLERILRDSAGAGASDIHLQPDDSGVAVLFRLDGVLASVDRLDRLLAERVIGRVKFLSRLHTYQDSMPQEGRIDRASTSIDREIRVATFPTVAGEKVVLRLHATGEPPSLDDLGFPAAAGSAVKSFLARGRGMALLTGPAGSGKTTTIYACLRELAAGGGRSIITVEDPVERVVPGVTQTEVRPAAGLTFAEAARHLLRQDPEALAIGEIRDEETAAIVVRAALTGHMVLSTLHAGSCRGVVDRLLDLGGDRLATVMSIRLVINQRLVRRVCPECRGSGCPACVSTGYRGRVPVVEWAAIDDDVRDRIRVDGARAVRPILALVDAARALVADGTTSEEEIARVIGR